METWMTLWTYLFAFCLTAFAGMAIWIIIGGWKDLQDMFRDLKNQPNDSPNNKS